MSCLKSWAIPYLVCPQCKSTLQIETFEKDPQGCVCTGAMVCTGKGCGCWYPIVRGIPRLLPEALRLDLTSEFVNTYREQLAGLECRLAESEPPKTNGVPVEVKQKNIEKFGFEWTKYDRFGWDDPVYNIAREEQAFLRKALLTRDEINGKLVLDAGCGNGRYSFWTAKYGAQVIGVELGDAVESAAKNTADLPNVQIIQGDIFCLPFPDRCFDAIFSIGVLMLTGSAKKATLSLASHVKEGGSLTVHVYGKGNAIYELDDRILRAWTTKMSIKELEQFTDRAYRLRCWLEHRKLIDFVLNFVRLDDHPHCIFDWYAAPVASHHTYQEVIQWLEEGGLQSTVTRHKVGAHASLRRKISNYLSKKPASITVKGMYAK